MRSIRVWGSNTGLTTLAVALLACVLSGCPGDGRIELDFTATPRSGVEDLSVRFSGTAEAVAPYVIAGKFRGDTDDDQPLYLLAWDWDFGDGGSATGSDPVHVYTDPGRYDVTLTLTYTDAPPEKQGELFEATLTRTGYINVLSGNAAPVADAGPDRTVFATETVQLDASGSSDPDGDALGFSWALTSKPVISALDSDDIVDAGTATPTFTPDVEGVYVLEVSVSDGEDTAADAMTLTAQRNQRPIANAGPDQEVVFGATVLLDGSGSSDPDGQPLTYLWSILVRPVGSNAALTGADTVQPTFIVDVSGRYVVLLTVNDGIENSTVDSVHIVTGNTPPVAVAGPDQTRTVGQTASLNGTNSFDVDGDALSYRWSFLVRPGGSFASISNQLSANASFLVDRPGEYIVTLIVNDGEDDSVPDQVRISTENSAPVADAGPDRSARVLDTVTLNGGGSSDVDGNPLTFAWQFTSVPTGSQAVLNNPNTVAPSFTIDEPGDYTVELIVNDGVLSSDPDTVTISTENSPPVADAGADLSRRVGQTASLNGGGSSDVDGDPLTFAWSFASRPAGSSAQLDDPESVTPSFLIDAPGDYVVQLIVSDATTSSQPDTVTVSTTNSAPVADAGPDLSRRVDQTVTLDGSGSSDVDGDPLTFAWSFTARPEGSAAVLDDPTDVTPSFVIDLPGDYILQLIVNDGILDSQPDTVVVSTVNSAPVADAGPDQSRRVLQVVTLDGSGSSDADGDPLTYAWSFVSAPQGADPQLSDPTATFPTFEIPAPGQYVVQLIVNDGTADSGPDTVTITTANSAPVANAGPDQSRLVLQTVTLDGSASSDVDGDPLTFTWSFSSRPEGSAAALDDPADLYPSFIIDLPGTYVVQLIVNDGVLDSEADRVRITTENSPPVANAGPDQSALVTDTVTLDGSASSDVDGDPLTFLWSLTTVPAGSEAVLDDPTLIAPSFTIDLPGQYVARLIVNDGEADSEADRVTITTENSPPVARAGADQSALVTELVTLNGSASSDVDGDPLTFLWTITNAPAGSAAALNDRTLVSPSFTIDLPGQYTVQLVVNDGMADSAPDTVIVTTENSAPVANAGPNQTALVTETVTLDGSASSDVDGDPLTFAWSLTTVPAGSAAALNDRTLVGPSFTIDLPGTYVAQLVVNDGAVDSAPDTVTISTENSPPVANAGPDQGAFVTDTVTLDGSGSTDVDGDPLTFAWSLTSMPSGSAAALDDETAVLPSFTIDLPGTYVAQLVVNDGAVDSAPDTVAISTDNSPPVADAGTNQTALVYDRVDLDGSGSSDVDGDPLTFAWSFTSRPAGSAAALSDPSAEMPFFAIDRAGNYVIQLVVNDGTTDSAPDTVTVSTENSAPVADAGPDAEVPYGSVVALDGTGSFDVDLDPLTYAWSFISFPRVEEQEPTELKNGVVPPPEFNDPASPTPTFLAYLPGDYVIQLIVNDGTVDSAPDNVVIRAVNSPPTVFLQGDPEVDVECGDYYEEEGAALIDPEEGNITHRLSIAGSVDTHTPGVYILTYGGTDGFGLEAPEVTRTVTVADTMPPVVTLIGDDPLYVECGDEQWQDPGAGAADLCDTSQLEVTSNAVDVHTLGPQIITYEATDATGLTGFATRTVHVVDTTTPLVLLIGADVLAVECGGNFTDPGAVASDACGPVDLPVDVLAEAPVDTSAPGTYLLYYQATDGSGNTASVSRTVIVEDTTAPTITLIGDNPLYLECGDFYEEPGAVADDGCDVELGPISVQGPGEAVERTNEKSVGTGLLGPGTYLVTYSVLDASGNEGTQTREVIVQDTEAPEITLLGDNPLYMPCDIPYEDPGAYSQDSCGEFPVETDSTALDGAARGVYTVTYSSTDAAGNTGTAERTVIVEGLCVSDNPVCPPPDPPGIPQGQLIYGAGFEADLEGWLPEDLLGGAPLWHRTAGACVAPNDIDSSPSVLYFGTDTTCNYDTGGPVAGQITSPPVPLPPAIGPMALMFNYRLSSDWRADFDVAAVEVSYDGVTFVPVAVNAPRAPLPLTGAEQILCDVTIGIGPVDVNKQSSSLPVPWQTAVIQLPPVTGPELHIRFSYYALDGIRNGGLGFVVDNIGVYGRIGLEPTGAEDAE